MIHNIGCIKSFIRKFARLREFLKAVLPYWIQLFVFSRVYEPEILHLKKLLRNAYGNAIDIGANHGIYSYYLSRICKMQKVYSFEPNPIPYTILAKKTKKHDNIEIHNVGISNVSEAKLSLNIPIAQNGHQITTRSTFRQTSSAHHESIDVTVTTLDSYNFSNVVFIKIDVEGYEDTVLSGSMDTIKQNKPILLIETDLNSMGENIKALLSFGYCCYYFINGNLSPIVTNTCPIDIPAHNIFFIHKETKDITL